MVGEPIYGWANLKPSGLINWSTFTTTEPIPTAGWVSVFKLVNQCGTHCGSTITNSGGDAFPYTEEIEFTETGTSEILMKLTFAPLKYVITLGNAEVLNTGYIGSTSYQTQLNSFLASKGLPNENIIYSTDTEKTFSVENVTPGSVLKVEVYSPFTDDWSFIVDCPNEAPINCVVSDWTDWSDWLDNGNHTETRTRTRIIVTPPSGGGQECPPLFDSETRESIDCEVSDWSNWSDWVDNGDHTETRTRTRTIVTPPSVGGKDCPALTDSEDRESIDCEVSAWSAWSAWVDNGNHTETRTHTRTIVQEPSIGGKDCPPLTESENRESIDCEVSAWSDWVNNGDGTETRTRTIIQEPSIGGNDCPNLTETRQIEKPIPLTVTFGGPTTNMNFTTTSTRLQADGSQIDDLGALVIVPEVTPGHDYTINPAVVALIFDPTATGQSPNPNNSLITQITIDGTPQTPVTDTIPDGQFYTKNFDITSATSSASITIDLTN